MRICSIAVMFMLCVSIAHADIELAGNVAMGATIAYALVLAVNEEEWEGSKQLVYSFAATQLTVQLLKLGIDAERPDYTAGDRKDSFPSGHTASAFSAATFIHKRYGFKEAIVPYIWAGFTGYSRVEADRHHWRDVAAGAVISGLFTWVFVDEYNVSVSADMEHVELRVGMRW